MTPTYCGNCGDGLPASSAGDLDAVCQACDLAAELLANRILDSAAMKIEHALNTKNAAKFKAMGPQTRRAIVIRALDAGHVRWRIA
jgi:phage/plasmid primase-like uncharacterized protein